MPRDLPIGNGRMLVTFDDEYRIRDIYYPFVGKENHVGGYYCRFGVYADGRFTWVERAHGWTLELGYEPNTLVTRVTCRNEALGVALTCSDCVDFHASLYVRRVEITNLRGQAREIRLFFHQDFRISESDVGDTAAYDPATHAIVHYKGNRYFLVNLLANGEVGVRKWAVGQKGQPGKEGTWRDAEDDGNLSGSPIAQGAVDSVVAAHVPVAGRGTAEVFYWIAAGPRWKGDWEGVGELNAKVVERGPASYVQRTRDYWSLWVCKEPIDFFDLSPGIVDLYRRSLLILRTQIDNGGAIIAANDSDITTFARDTYSYMWPRDGALVAHALDLAGYQEPPRRFFEFCADVLSPEGYLMHKYTPDRALGSSWHPWIGPNGDAGAQTPQLPIQEDETALVIWALWKHFQRYRDIEDLRGLYGRLVKKAAAFLVSYRDPTTKLPGPSYDLWEERRGILTFTCGSVIGGLHAAAQFATIFGECDLARRYESAAQEIRQGMDTHLWRPELGRFARMVRVHGGAIEVDTTIDASLYGAFAFGAYPPDDPRVAATMKAIREQLWCKTEVGGVARYTNDYYFQVGKDIATVPGNPWFICTMWLAQYAIAHARTSADLEPARQILSWVDKRKKRSGVLAEQVNPYTGAPLSVAPLTWSHATVVTLVQEYLDRCEALELKYPGTKRRYRKEQGYERPEPEIPLEQAQGPGSGPVAAPAPVAVATAATVSAVPVAAAKDPG